MREDPGPEQVGLGYRVVSAVGVTKDVLVRFIVFFELFKNDPYMVWKTHAHCFLIIC